MKDRTLKTSIKQKQKQRRLYEKEDERQMEENKQNKR